MPVQSNLCSMLVNMKHDVVVCQRDVNTTKGDLCEMVDARIGQIILQLISTPYCSNFSFEIDKPSELDAFDRAALQQMEASDDFAVG
jgi:hypothetical protein